MLGTDLRGVLDGHDLPHTDVTRGDIDLTDETAVMRAVAGHDVVVNCAAWTAVDDAEEHEAEAYTANAVVPGLLARAARAHDARLIQVSTDYVFDGRASTPYAEDAALAPRSAYGRTKGAGEWAVRAEAPQHALVLRTAWLYGAHGGCFPRTIARVAREKGGLDVVDDQVGQPTWTRDVAELMVRLVQADAPAGTWHATAAGQASWWEFARAVVDDRRPLSRDRPPHRLRLVRAPGSTSGVQRARSRPAGRSRCRADRRLARAVGGGRPLSAGRAVSPGGTRRSRTCATARPARAAPRRRAIPGARPPPPARRA